MKPGRGFLFGILIVAAGLRVAHVLALRGTPWFDHLIVDPEYYDAWAQRIAAGDWLGERAFYMDPLYPYVLGILYRLRGHDLLAARLLNVAFSVGACGLVGGLGRRVGGPTIGALAALGFALYKPDVYYVGELDKTSLSVLLAAATVALAFGRTLPARFGAGVALALTALTRANFLLFAPLVPLAFLLDPAERRERIGPASRATCGAALFVAGFGLVLLPVAWRNHHVSGEWVITTAQAGQNFYTGNNESNPYGAFGAVPFVRANPHFEEDDFRANAEARAGHALAPRQVSAFWFDEALAHMRAHPGFAARALGWKALLFWNDFEISDSQDQYLLERDSPVLRLPLPGFGALAMFAVLGACAGFRARRPVRLLCGFVLVYWASVVAFFLFSRYRIQIVPVLSVLAALGAVALGGWLRAGDRRRLAAAGVVLAGVGVLTFHRVGVFSRDHPRTVEMRLRHLATIYMTVGQPERAIGALQEAIPGCTHGCPWAAADLFQIYFATGRFAEGEAYFRDFVRRYPAQEDAPGYLERLQAAGSAQDHR